MNSTTVLQKIKKLLLATPEELRSVGTTELEAETVEVEDIPQTHTAEVEDEATAPEGSVEMEEEETEEEEVEVEDTEEEEVTEEEEDMVAKLAYRIDELESRLSRFEEMFPDEEEVEDEELEEDEDLPQLDGAPVDDTNFSAMVAKNTKSYGKKQASAQARVLARLNKLN